VGQLRGRVATVDGGKAQQQIGLERSHAHELGLFGRRVANQLHRQREDKLMWPYTARVEDVQHDLAADAMRPSQAPER
jgi:hypothetical protein